MLALEPELAPVFREGYRVPDHNIMKDVFSTGRNIDLALGLWMRHQIGKEQIESNQALNSSEDLRHRSRLKSKAQIHLLHLAFESLELRPEYTGYVWKPPLCNLLNPTSSQQRQS